MEILKTTATDEVKKAAGIPPQTSSSRVDELQAVTRQRAISSLYFFNTAVLNWDRIRQVPHLPLCNFIQEVAHPRRKRKVVLIPRDCYKSTIGSKGLPLWIIVQPEFCGLPGKEHRILLVSHSSENAKKQVKSLKQQVERNTIFQWLFPDTIPKFGDTTWTDNALRFPREGFYGEETIEVGGIDTHLVSRHYTVQIADDLEDHASFESPTVRARVKTWYKASEALFVEEATAYHLLIGTRWGIDDVYADIKANESETYEFYTRPLEWDRDTLEADLRTSREKGIPSTYDMDPEEHAPDPTKKYYFFPELFPADACKRIRQKQGQMMYSMLYLNDPRDESLMEFKKSDFRFWEFSSTGNILISDEEGQREEILFDSLLRVMFWDPALTEEKLKKGCRNAIVVCFYDGRKHRLFFAEGIAVKKDPTQLCNRFIGLHLRYSIHTAAVEDAGFQRTLLYPLRHQMFEMEHSFPVKLKPAIQSKDMRIRSLIPYFEQHNVFIRRHCADLIEEFEGYPMLPYKDLIDAAAACLELTQGKAHHVLDEHTARRLQKEEDTRLATRSSLTGY